MRRRLVLVTLVLVVVLGWQVAAGAAAVYTDVTGHWAEGVINALSDKDILGGYGDRTFRPDRDISRAEFTKVLVKAAGLTLAYPAAPSFTDVPAGAWYFPFIEAAVAYGMVVKDAAQFRPDEPILREDMVVMLVRALGKAGLAREKAGASLTFVDAASIPGAKRGYVAVASELGLIAGVGGGRFAPQGKATRAQAAAIAFRFLNADRTPPVAQIGSAGGTQIVIRLSEPVGAAEAESLANYQLVAMASGTAVPVISARLQEGSQAITLGTGTLTTGADYRLTVGRLLDRWQNALTGATFEFRAGADSGPLGLDNVPPEVVSVGWDSGKVKVEFNETVDPVTAGDYRNYTLRAGDDLSRFFTVSRAERADNGRTVYLTTDARPGAATYYYRIANVTDLKGNGMVPVAGLLGAAAPVTGPVREVRTYHSSAVEILFDQTVGNAGVSSNYAMVKVGTAIAVPINYAAYDSDARKAILYLSEALENGKTYTITISNLQDQEGKSLPNVSLNYTAAINLKRPLITYVKSPSADSLVVDFDKPLSSTVQVLVDIDGASFSSTKIVGSTAIFNNISPGLEEGRQYRLTISNATDREGNMMNSTYRLFTPDRTADAGVRASVAPQVGGLQITYSERVDADSARTVGNYTISPAGISTSLITANGVSFDYDSGKVVTLRRLTAALGDRQYQLQISGVKDLSGKTLSFGTILFNGVDTTPPGTPGATLLRAVFAGKDGVKGDRGAAEPNAYVKIYIDSTLVAVVRAGVDGSFGPVSFDRTLLPGTSIKVIAVDEAGNASPAQTLTY